MSLENGRCPCCNGALILDNSHTRAVCRYCGHELLIEQAIQKCQVDGIATYDAIMLNAERAMEDKDYDLARKRYKEALSQNPDDYRVLWGIFLCEIFTLEWYKNLKGYVAYPGDLKDNFADAVNRYGMRAQNLAPEESKPYYYSVMRKAQDFLFPPPAPKKKSGCGCYVATCVYGSYDCPEVWTLRRYRDDVLAKSVRGRIFVRMYYGISPTIVRIFGKTTLFRRTWKRVLDKKVKKLNAEGVENTPYQDREW